MRSREYEQKVTAMQKYSRFSPSVADEKSLQAWVDDMLKIALALDRKKEARERERMEQEDSKSQQRQSWDEWARPTRLVTISECSSLTEDVRLDFTRCRMLSESSVVSPFTTKVIPANEADTLGDRSGELVESRDSFAGVYPEDKSELWSAQWND